MNRNIKGCQSRATRSCFVKPNRNKGKSAFLKWVNGVRRAQRQLNRKGKGDL